MPLSKEDGPRKDRVWNDDILVTAVRQAHRLAAKNGKPYKIYLDVTPGIDHYVVTQGTTAVGDQVLVYSTFGGWASDWVRCFDVEKALKFEDDPPIRLP